MTVHEPRLFFASPRKLPRPGDLPGRVVVLDIAFAADGLGKGFAKTTGRFIETLGARLAVWVDHHDHPMHGRFARDDRFVLSTKAEHGACPEMITPALVARIGPVDCILCHFDVDGLFSAAKWLLQGKEPYPGADDDARAIDTRIGTPSPLAEGIDQALRAHWADPVLKQRIVHYLVNGLKKGIERDAIDEAIADFRALSDNAKRLAEDFVVVDGIARFDVGAKTPSFDKTELLLLGQERAQVAVVVEAGNATIAASFESGLDFVELLGLGGGMPTRVNIPEGRLGEAVSLIAARIREKTGGTS